MLLTLLTLLLKLTATPNLSHLLGAHLTEAVPPTVHLVGCNRSNLLVGELIGEGRHAAPTLEDLVHYHLGVLQILVACEGRTRATAPLLSVALGALLRVDLAALLARSLSAAGHLILRLLPSRLTLSLLLTSLALCLLLALLPLLLILLGLLYRLTLSLLLALLLLPRLLLAGLLASGHRLEADSHRFLGPFAQLNRGVSCGVALSSSHDQISAGGKAAHDLAS